MHKGYFWREIISGMGQNDLTAQVQTEQLWAMIIRAVFGWDTI